VPADGALSGSPSVFFDTVAILAPKDPPKTLPLAAPTTEWLQKAFNHRKVMAYSSGAKTILDRTHVAADSGVVLLSGASSVAGYIKAAKHGRLWDRVLAGEEGG
jgi:catalase